VDARVPERNVVLSLDRIIVKTGRNKDEYALV